MIVRLDDGYNRPNKIVVYTASGEPVPLASKASRRAKKAEREKRKQARAEAKTRRVTSRQNRRADRVEQKEERKHNKRAAKVQRKKNKLVRATGKQAIIEARQEKKLNQINNDIDNQNSMNPDDGSQTDPTQQYYTPDYTDSTTDMIPDDSQQSYDEYELMPEEEYQDEMQDLAGGLIGTALDAIKGAVSGVVNQGKAKVTQAVNTKVSRVPLVDPYYTKYMNEVKARQAAEEKANAANRMSIYTGIGGLVVGAIAAKALTK